LGTSAKVFQQENLAYQALLGSAADLATDFLLHMADSAFVVAAC
jgi:hypothetical protein